MTDVECRAEALPVLVDQLLQLRFVNWCSAGIQGFHKGHIHVDADDFESLAREHSREGGAELPQADDRNLHSSRIPPLRATGVAYGNPIGLQKRHKYRTTATAWSLPRDG